MREKMILRRLNWVDWVILGALLTGIVLSAWWITSRRQAATPTQSVRYRICVSGVDSRMAEASGGWTALIPRDASVTSANGAIALGKVVAVWESEHLEAALQNGEIAFVPHAGMIDLYVEIRADATVRESDGVRVGDVRIAAADTGDFRVGGYLARGARVVWVEVDP